MKTGRVIEKKLSYSIDEADAYLLPVLDIMTFESKFGFQFAFQCFDRRGGNGMILQETPDGKRVKLEEFVTNPYPGYVGNIIDPLEGYVTNGTYYETNSASTMMSTSSIVTGKIVIAWRPRTWDGNIRLDYSSTVYMRGCWSNSGISSTSDLYTYNPSDPPIF